MSGYGTATLEAFARAVRFTAGFDGMSADAAPSVGDDSTQALFRGLTHDRIAPLGTFSYSSRRAAGKVRLLDQALGLYRAVMPILAVLAMLAFIIQTVEAIRRRSIPEICVVQAGLLGALSALLAGLALIDVTSFPVIGPLYLTAAYPVLILFVSLALYEKERMLLRQGPGWWKRIFALRPAARPGPAQSPTAS